MKKSTLLLLLITVLMFSASAQTSVRAYKTKEGITYTKHQVDSIANLGYPIGIVDKIEKSDSVILIMEIYPKVSETPFQVRFQGKKLKDLVLVDIHGNKIETKKLDKGLMINFWSVTCGPCIAEIPQLNELKAKFDETHMFIGIAPENPEKVKAFLAEHKFNFIIVADSEVLFKELGIDGYPKNMFINQQGIVVKVNEGTPMTRKTPSDPWKIGVVEIYSPILTAILDDK